MTIIESKVTPGGYESVPYGDSSCAVDYMDSYSGVIEIESNPDFIASGDWKEAAAELIYKEHNSDGLLLTDVFAYADYIVKRHPTKPGTYLIEYSV